MIAGGGLAGFRTVQELRARGYQGEVILIGAEPRPPYDRPPLSKKLMTGALDDTSLDADAAALGAEFRLGESAAGLAGLGESAAGGGVLRTDRGEYRFGRLVVATGAAPVRLPGTGPQRVLRSLDDALQLRSVLRPGLRLAVVGAGWIGAELATAAAARGCQVTVLEAGPAPVAGALGAEAGATTVPWYAEAGVDLRLSQAVESIEPGGLALPGGGWLAADEVVTAVGVRPETGWLDSSGVKLDNGVVVDDRLRASAAGVSRPGTAHRSGRGAMGGGCGSSTGIPRCTHPRWWRRTCSVATRSTTRCPTSGRSSSAGWFSTWAITAGLTG